MFSTAGARARVREAPFRPFQLVTSSGDVHDVLHPELIMVGVRDLAVGIPSSEHPGVYDRMTRIAIIHITEMRDLPQAVTSNQNGSTP